jgi:hypothetical protein
MIPLILYVVFRVISIQKIDNIEQSSKIDFYLGILYNSNQSLPTYEFINSNENQLINEIKIEYNKAPDFSPVQNNDTWMYYEQRISGVFQSAINLRNFPFDSQEIKVVIEPLDETIDQIILKPMTMELLPTVTDSLPDWITKGIKGEIGSYVYQPYNEEFSRLTVLIGIKRDSGFYMTRIVVGLILLVIMGLSLHFIDIDNSDMRIGGALTVYLTMIAYLLVVSSDVPKISYVTNLDSFILGSQVIIFWMIILNILICVRLDDGITDPEMRKIHNANEHEIRIEIKNETCKKILNPLIINRISLLTTTLVYIIICSVYLK